MSGEIRIDLRDDAVLVPEGAYEVEVEDVTLRETRNGASNYLNLRLRVIEGEYADAVLWMPASLRPDLGRMLRRILRVLGVEDEELSIETEDAESGDPSVTRPDLVGQRALAHVVHDEYMGEVRPKVKRIEELD